MPEIDLLKSPKLNQKLLLHEIISILTSRIFLKTSNPGILSILSITDPAMALEFFFYILLMLLVTDMLLIKHILK